MTGALTEVLLAAVPVGRLRATAGRKAWERLTDAQARVCELLAGRTVWSINSTEIGGGVAEMLRTMLPYAQAGGVDARWLIVRGSADFFRVTKRVHNLLHGHLGDSGPLGEAERSVYERVIEDAGWTLRDVIRPGDVVVLHDPQTLGLASGLKRLGATVIWRCHIGTDKPGELSGMAWDFLWQYIEEPDVAVVLAARKRALATAARVGKDHRSVDRSVLGEERGHAYGAGGRNPRAHRAR